MQGVCGARVVQFCYAASHLQFVVFIHFSAPQEKTVFFIWSVLNLIDDRLHTLPTVTNDDGSMKNSAGKVATTIVVVTESDLNSHLDLKTGNFFHLKMLKKKDTGRTGPREKWAMAPVPGQITMAFFLFYIF